MRNEVKDIDMMIIEALKNEDKKELRRLRKIKCKQAGGKTEFAGLLFGYVVAELINRQVVDEIGA